MILRAQRSRSSNAPCRQQSKYCYYSMDDDMSLVYQFDHQHHTAASWRERQRNKYQQAAMTYV